MDSHHCIHLFLFTADSAQKSEIKANPVRKRIRNAPPPLSQDKASIVLYDLCLVDAVYDGILPQVGVQGHKRERLLETGLKVWDCI
jgi:hypothetical protein